MKFTAVLALIAGSYAIRLSGPVGPMGQPVEPFCANCTPLPVVVGAATANADPAGEPAPAGSPGRGLIGAPIIALAQTTNLNIIQYITQNYNYHTKNTY